ncbi:xylulokinase (plasmid) [Deinococcus metallilatus]|uniref:Xylulose kinase n=1 Tax=Deinococcus metallilatus TaxID=1211322 RepID=A0AAJ5JZX6_9DEIO|nr:xylulokinase [Deinococcus metallilatus]MBB5293487.1 xylulokinase [Deinococcus metallilatus]QBY06569.1 xylulokinase [Deinococcus metallilatus]RXJ17912.1 xylulokinase [Deinococcus metallilatus]TLK32184.1 xylulokinase [Deinococcus metallilatus]GMA15293.1 xylulokinase [Deinococcus metallilatus]
MTGTPVVLGLDLGTSGVKAVALDREGRKVAEAGGSYPLLTPRPGWTEQRPQDWVAATLDALGKLAEGLHALGAAPLALGLSGQMHGLVALDAQGEVVRPAPLWNDQRTGAQVQAIEERIPRPDLIARTGNRAVTGFQLPKLLWLRDTEPEAFRRTWHALLPKDYLGFVLTGEMRTEPSDASGVGALNLAERRWDQDVLRALDLDPALFPKVVNSWDVTGTLRPDLARQTGLPAGLPVVAGGGDNAAAGIALGLGSAQPGTGSVSLGTSGVLFAPLTQPRPDPEGRVHLFAHADGGYHLLGVTLACAGALQWLRDRLAPEASFDTLLAEAAQVPGGAEGLTFLPYLAGERSPHMNPDLRGAWVGLSLAHGRAHLTRALLEGTAFALADAFEVMRPLAPVTTLLATGGGARSDLWLELVSGALGVQVRRTSQEPGAAEGAALLAMPAAGLYPSLKDVMQALQPGSTPVAQRDARAARERFLQTQRRLQERP